MVREEIRAFITERLMLGIDPGTLDESGSLMDQGVLDSVGVLELVAFLEQNWAIQIDDGELVRENLDSVDNLVGFVERKVA